jgi:DNA-binding IclR family transcriptional regulator
MRLVEVQQLTGLTRGTVHRILGALSRYGLVEQDFGSRRYYIDREANFISSEYSRRAECLRILCWDPLREAASKLGSTLLLLARANESTICIDRYSGAARSQPLTVEIGTRRPLIAGAGGIAILSTLPHTESETIMRDASRRYPEYLHYATLRTIHHAVTEARRRGYAFSDGYARPNVRAIGVVIRDCNGATIGALAAAAAVDRLDQDAIDRIVSVLQEKRTAIEDSLKQSTSRNAAIGSALGFE